MEMKGMIVIEGRFLRLRPRLRGFCEQIVTARVPFWLQPCRFGDGGEDCGDAS
jgi:hypothetical protein